jgi:hypothetical protein
MVMVRSDELNSAVKLARELAILSDYDQAAQKYDLAVALAL